MEYVNGFEFGFLKQDKNFFDVILESHDERNVLKIVGVRIFLLNS